MAQYRTFSPVPGVNYTQQQPRRGRRRRNRDQEPKPIQAQPVQPAAPAQPAVDDEGIPINPAQRRQWMIDNKKEPYLDPTTGKVRIEDSAYVNRQRTAAVRARNPQGGKMGIQLEKGGKYYQLNPNDAQGLVTGTMSQQGIDTLREAKQAAGREEDRQLPGIYKTDATKGMSRYQIGVKEGVPDMTPVEQYKQNGRIVTADEGIVPLDLSQPGAGNSWGYPGSEEGRFLRIEQDLGRYQTPAQVRNQQIQDQAEQARTEYADSFSPGTFAPLPGYSPETMPGWTPTQDPNAATNRVRYDVGQPAQPAYPAAVTPMAQTPPVAAPPAYPGAVPQRSQAIPGQVSITPPGRQMSITPPPGTAQWPTPASAGAVPPGMGPARGYGINQLEEEARRRRQTQQGIPPFLRRMR